MQSWPQLHDQDVADVLNFVLTRFNAKLLPSGFKPVTSDEVNKARATKISTGDVRKERAALMTALAAHHIGE
jgi:hypothetical protein